MPRKYVNPLDPATGRRLRGRPRKNLPVDTIQGPQSVEHAVGQNGGAAPAEVHAVDDRQDIENSTPTAQFWRERMRGTSKLAVPSEVQRQYPNIPLDCYCWAPNTTQGVSEYREEFGYELVQLAKPMRGQTDTNVTFRELVLMVRTPDIKRIHDEVRREAVVAAHGGDPEGHTQSASREALQEVAADGGRRSDVSFFDEEDTLTPAMQRRMSTAEIKDRIEADQRRARIKGAAGRGSKYVQGGIPK